MIVAVEKARERGSKTFEVSFFDENDEAVTPDSVKWSLLNENHEVVNGREYVDVTPGETIDISVYGDDLDSEDGLKREIDILAEIESIYGGTLPQTEKILFDIEEIPYSREDT
jgi:hypothetical protein